MVWLKTEEAHITMQSTGSRVLSVLVVTSQWARKVARVLTSFEASDEILAGDMVESVDFELVLDPDTGDGDLLGTRSWFSPDVSK